MNRRPTPIPTARRFEDNKSRHTRYCNEFDCGKPTNNSKPFCQIHVESNPYVKGIRIVINERIKEIEMVNKRGRFSINIEGSIAKDIIQLLTIYGECTINRLARDMNLDLFIAKQYVIKLKRKRYVMFRKTTRGTLVIQAAA